MKRLICLGDSNTYGFDPRSFLGSRYPAEIRWTGRLAAEGYEAVNCGQNGLRIYRPVFFPHLLSLIKSKGPADRVLVMLGTNDILMGEEPEDCAEAMEELLVFLREEAEGTPLLIAPPTLRLGDWVESEAMIASSEMLREEYRELAKRQGVDFADAGDWGVELCFDGVHFSPAGHAAFAESLLRHLENR